MSAAISPTEFAALCEARPLPSLTHLQRLEAESIDIMRARSARSS